MKFTWFLFAKQVCVLSLLFFLRLFSFKLLQWNFCGFNLLSILCLCYVQTNYMKKVAIYFLLSAFYSISMDNNIDVYIYEHCADHCMSVHEFDLWSVVGHIWLIIAINSRKKCKSRKINGNSNRNIWDNIFYLTPIHHTYMYKMSGDHVTVYSIIHVHECNWPTISYAHGRRTFMNFKHVSDMLLVILMGISPPFEIEK